MLLELHCHTTRYSSCSHLEPVDAVRRVVAKGLQGLVVTEHGHLWSPEELQQLRREAELGEGFVLLSGQEAETDLGHVLVFGADRSIPDRVEVGKLRAQFPSAALVLAHPWRHDKIPRPGRLAHPALDAVEIFNSNHSARGNYLGLAAWHEDKFVATAGSDAHAERTAGMYPTQLDHPVEDLDGLVAEIRAGRCRPFFKEIPRAGSNLSLTDITIGTKGADEFRHRIVVKRFTAQGKWRRAREATRVVAALGQSGFTEGRFRVPRVLEVDERRRLLIEEGQRGKSLHDLFSRADPRVADEAFALAVGWLARTHRLGLCVTSLQDARKREEKRYRSYLKAFTVSRSPYLERAQTWIEHVAETERRMLEAPEDFVQCHGDYHPKNILIGQDWSQDATTTFVSVIDFDSSLCFPPAFDVATFLAQFRYQLRAHPGLLDRYGRDRLLAAYRQAGGQTPAGFDAQVDFFELRVLLSMAAFLIKVGKGESGEMAGLMARAEALAERSS